MLKNQLSTHPLFANFSNQSPTSPPLFIMPQKSPQAIPVIRLHVDVTHAALQAALQRIRIPPEHPHHHTPTDARKHRPRIVANPLAHRTRMDYVCAWLHRPLCQREHHSCEYVDDNLFVHRRDRAGARSLPEHQVAAKQA